MRFLKDLFLEADWVAGLVGLAALVVLFGL